MEQHERSPGQHWQPFLTFYHHHGGIVHGAATLSGGDPCAHTAGTGDPARQLLEEFVEVLLTSKLDQGKAASLAKTLTEGRWTHDYPIFPSQAEALGLPVIRKLPRAIYDLMDFYPQAVQARPSVQYIPLPYRPLGSDSKSFGPGENY